MLSCWRKMHREILGGNAHQQLWSTVFFLLQFHFAASLLCHPQAFIFPWIGPIANPRVLCQNDLPYVSWQKPQTWTVWAVKCRIMKLNAYLVVKVLLVTLCGSIFRHHFEPNATAYSKSLLLSADAQQTHLYGCNATTWATSITGCSYSYNTITSNEFLPVQISKWAVYLMTLVFTCIRACNW